MAIEVGALVLAIGADNQQAIAALRSVDRAGEDSARRNARWALDQERAAMRRATLAERELAAGQRLVQAQINRNRLGLDAAPRAVSKADRDIARAEQAHLVARRNRAQFDKSIAAASVQDEQRIAQLQRRRMDLTEQADLAAARSATKRSRLQEVMVSRDNALNANAHLAGMKWTRQGEQAQAAYWMRRIRERNADVAAEARSAATIMRYRERVERQRLSHVRRQERLNLRGEAQGLGLSSLGLTAGFAAGFAIRDVVRMSNEYQVLNQRLQVVTKSQSEANLIFEKLGEVATNTRNPLGSITELYAKLRISNDRLGLSQRETLQVTEAFSNALRASGSTGQAAASAMLQFGQAMAKGKLDGDEFRTAAENNAVMMVYLAKSMGVSQGALLKLREEGKLTARELADAMIKYRKEIEELANKAPLTMVQGLTMFQNSLIRVIGHSQDMKAAANNIAQSFKNAGMFIEKYGEAVIRVAKGALAVAATAVAFRTLSRWMAAGAISAAGLLRVLGGPLGLFAVLAEGAYAIGKFFGEKSSSGTARAEAAALAEAGENMTKLTGLAHVYYSQRIEAEKRLNGLLAKSDEETAASMARTGRGLAISGPSQETARAVEAAQKEYLRVKNAEAKVREQMAAVMGLDAPGSVVSGEDEADKAKKLKDTTDAYLSQLKELQAANAMRIEDGRRAIKILAQEEAVLADATSSTKRYAEALERINKLRELGFMTSRDKPAGGLDSSLPTLQDEFPFGDVRRHMIPVEKQDFPLAKTMSDDRFKLWDLNNSSNPQWDLWTASQTEQFNEAMANFGENMRRGFSTTLADSIRDGMTEGFSDRRTGASGMRLFFTRIRNMLGEQLASLGTEIIDHGSKYVLKGLGKLFQKVGLSMGIFGKLMLKFQAALASHPLAMGAVAIAVGVALSALAGSISTAAREGGGGDVSGTLGGLSIGNGGVAPQTYIFPRERAKTTPEGTTTSSSSGVVVNFNGPIIGPNDPSAQRQIMTLIDNAQRRGLGSGSNGRSV